MSYQQHYYENQYYETGDHFGMPDRKISDSRIIKDKKILTVGGGKGTDIWYLSKNNLTFCMDYSKSGLIGGSQHGIQGVFGDFNSLSNLPFEEKSFDIIVCKDILEHLLQPLELMVDLSRILKDDGYLIISVPNHFFLTQRIRMLFGKGLVWKSIGIDHSKDFDSWNYMHIRFFTFDSLKRLLEITGFFPEKWFWDFGTLAHYQNPDMWIEPQEYKRSIGKEISTKGKVGVFIVKPIWYVFNIIIPKFIRIKLVSMSPGILCAGFYVRVKKKIMHYEVICDNSSS